MENISREQIRNRGNDNQNNENNSKTNIKEDDDKKIIKDINTGFIESEEQKKLKLKHIKNYSKFEIIKKSLFISSRNWKHTIFSVIKGMINQYFSVKNPLLSGKLYDAINKKSIPDIKNALKSYIFFIFIKLIIDIFFHIFSYLYINYSIIEYKNLVLENISKKDIEFFDVFKTGELLERIGICERSIEQDFFKQTFELLQNITKFIFICYYLFTTSLRISIIYIIIMIIKFLCDYCHDQFSEMGNFKKRHKLFEKYFGCLNEFISNIRLVKSFGNEEIEMEKLKNLKKVFHNDRRGLGELIWKIMDFLHDGGSHVLIFYAGIETIKGRITLGELMIFQKYSNDLRWTIKKFRDIFNKYIELLEGWTKFFEIYDYTPKVISKKDLKPEKIKGEIEFDNVKFSYPLKPNVLILNHLSFKIQPGKVLAIVGHSGSGKSTISNLIQRFYDPNEGIIKLDGIDIRDLNSNWYHKNLGLVSQEPVLNNGSIEDNITYGVREYSQNDFNNVCELSSVSNFVKDNSQFPDGYKTIVGERGVQVSGGQKQRIAIARALMKNVKILIFDEATSALDAESENDVQSAINNIIKKKNITTVIIAHRLSTIRNADTIIFLDKGRIVESGTHDELIALDGEYKKLVQKQLIS